MKNETQKLFDEALNACRADTPDAARIAESAARVWANIQPHTPTNQNTMSEHTMHSANSAAVNTHAIKSCADFQSLIPAYLDDSLSASRALLLRDHTRECVACRRRLNDAKEALASFGATGEAARLSPVQSENHAKTFLNHVSLNRLPAASWRIAAAVMLACCALIAWFAWQPFGKSGWSDLTVEAADGALYPVEESNAAALAKGARLALDKRVRTAKDARAVLSLPDGSQIEMRERSQLYVTNTSGGATINLERGQIIVEAAKQANGKHLFVRTPDALVSVKGTIFSVNSGTSGARVAVLEGAVEVDAANAVKLLAAGDQATTREGLEPASLANEIGWSAKADRYRAMLREAARLGKEIDARAPLPGKRYSTRLLDLTAPETVFYAALPNIGTQLADSYNLLNTRLNENPELKNWWTQNSKSSNTNASEDVNFIFQHLREWSGRIGDEVAVSAKMNPSNRAPEVLLLAEVKNDAEFRAFLEQEIAALQTKNANAAKHLRFRFLDDATGNLAAKETARENVAQESKGVEIKDVFIRTGNNIFAASTDANAVRDVANRINGSSGGSNSRDAFHQRVADVYRNGTNFVLAADLNQIISHRHQADKAAREIAAQVSNNAERAAKGQAMFHQTGFDDLQFLIVEAREVDEANDDSAKRIDNRVTVSFNNARRGVASWLATPNAMGALDYISPDATLAAAFVMKQPTAVADDLMTMLGAVDANAVGNIEAAQAKLGVNVREDLAAPLGGEFAIAIDGPVLPVPSWKLIVEVYNPARLQNSLAQLVKIADEQSRAAGKPGIELVRSELNNQTYYTIKSALAPAEVNYTFADKYFIAAPTRALLDRTLSLRASGVSLRQAPRFVAALPNGVEPNFSALFYQNVSPLIDDFAPYAARATSDLRGNTGSTSDLNPKKVVSPSFLATRAPALAYAQAYDDRIVFAMPSNGAPFGLTPSALLGLPGESQSLQKMIQSSAR